MSLEFTIAECAIRQLHADFVDAVWRQDADDFAECFASDGVWKIAGREMVGRDTIRGDVGLMLGYCRRIQLIVQTPQLRIDGKHATGRQPMVEFSQPFDGDPLMTIGYYHDEYVCEDGNWRFALRHWSLKYRGAPDFNDAFANTPDYGTFPAGPAHDEPTLASVRTDLD